jgi:hypothetical protein
MVGLLGSPIAPASAPVVELDRLSGRVIACRPSVALPPCSWFQLLGLIGPVLILVNHSDPRLRLRDRIVQRLNTLLME